MENLHSQHEQALGGLVVAHEVAALESQPQDLPDVFKDRQTRAFDTLSAHAGGVQTIMGEAVHTLGNITNPHDRRVLDRARNAFGDGRFDKAYRIIDDNASDNPARRAIRTAMDAGTFSKVRGIAGDLYTQKDMHAGLLVNGKIRKLTEDFASSSTALPLLRAAAGREVAAASMKFNRSTNHADATRFLNEGAHSPEDQDLLFSLQDVVLLDRITEQVRRGMPNAHSQQTINRDASNSSIRKALLGYLNTLQPRRPKEEPRAQQTNTGSRRQHTETPRAEQTREKQGSARPGTSSSEKTEPQTPRREAKKIRILTSQEKERVSAAIKGVKTGKYVEEDKIRKMLGREPAVKILSLMEKVDQMRADAKGQDKELSDKQIYMEFRRLVEVGEKKGEKSVDKPEHHEFNLLASLMGFSVKGKLPF